MIVDGNMKVRLHETKRCLTTVRMQARQYTGNRLGRGCKIRKFYIGAIDMHGSGDVSLSLPVCPLCPFGLKHIQSFEATKNHL